MYSVLNIANQHGNARDLKCNRKTDACRLVKQCIINAIILGDIWVSGTAGVGGWIDGVVTRRRTFRWRRRLNGNVAFARLDRRTRLYTRRCTAESMTSHKHNSRIETTHTKTSAKPKQRSMCFRCCCCCFLLTPQHTQIERPAHYERMQHSVLSFRHQELASNVSETEIIYKTVTRVLTVILRIYT